MYSLSPIWGTNAPLGITVSPPRTATQKSTLAEVWLLNSLRERPATQVWAVTSKPIMSMRPRANGSTEKAEGVDTMRAISCAAAKSGLMTMSRPISFFSISASRRYSGLRTRAMVWPAPSFLAMKQQSRFVSSRLVTAMTRSAACAPASFSTRMEAPLPSMHMTSSAFSALCKAAALSSTITMSWRSPANWLAMA